MKYKLTTARIVVLVVVLNLVVAVAAIMIQPFVWHNPCQFLPTVVVYLMTFPVFTFIGNPIVSSTSMWAIPVFLLMLILNAVIWGIVGAFGVRLCGWLYRLLWIEPDAVVGNDRNNLKWDVLFVVFTHAILLAILIGLLISLGSGTFDLLGEFSGTLPLPARLLLASYLSLQKYSLVGILLLIGFLYIDGRIYLWLCRTRGKKDASIWAISVTGIILSAIIWYVTIAMMFLNTLIHWKIK